MVAPSRRAIHAGTSRAWRIAGSAAGKCASRAAPAMVALVVDVAHSDLPGPSWSEVAVAAGAHWLVGAVLVMPAPALARGCRWRVG